MKVQEINITSSNGMLKGYISLPSENIKGMLICLHGSPNGNYHGNTDVFDQLTKAVINHGFATIQFSFYGSEPSDGHPSEACIRTQIADFEAVLEYIKANFKVPVFIVGESAGATIASSSWKSEVAGYVLLWPAFDLKDTDLSPYLNESRQKEIDENGFFDDNGMIIGKELFSELLSKDFSENFQLPEKDILIIHGQSDVEAPYYQSLKALKTARSDIEFLTKKDAGHGFKEQQNRTFVIDKTVDWLIKRV